MIYDADRHDDRPLIAIDWLERQAPKHVLDAGSRGLTASWVSSRQPVRLRGQRRDFKAFAWTLRIRRRGRQPRSRSGNNISN
jgi:hypothetical protein